MERQSRAQPDITMSSNIVRFVQTLAGFGCGRGAGGGGGGGRRWKFPPLNGFNYHQLASAQALGLGRPSNWTY